MSLDGTSNPPPCLRRALHRRIFPLWPAINPGVSHRHTFPWGVRSVFASLIVGTLPSALLFQTSSRELESNQLPSPKPSPEGGVTKSRELDLLAKSYSDQGIAMTGTYSTARPASPPLRQTQYHEPCFGSRR